MSGFEIAGAVLGALPILFEAIDLSKEGIQRASIAFRKRIYVGKLSRALLLQKQTLAETIKSLAIASGCADVWRLDHDPFEYLNDQIVKEQVMDYLGSENYLALGGALDDSYDAVKKIAGNIAGLIPNHKGPSEDLIGIIRASQETRAKHIDLFIRVKLMFNAKQLKSAVEELDSATSSIDRFTRVILVNRQMIKDTPSKKAARLAKGLRQVRDFAGSLDVALVQSWKEECHTQHEARLFLEDRVDTASDVLERVKSPRTVPMLAFQLILTASVHEGPTWSHETAVDIFKEEIEDDTKDEGTVVHKPMKPLGRVKIVELKPAGPVAPKVTLVSNICSTIEEATYRKRRASFVLTKNQKIGMLPMSEKPLLPCCDSGTTTLKELLIASNKSPSNIGHLLPLKLRMLLALKLSSNLLQLVNTNWLKTAWSKGEVFFLLGSEIIPRHVSQALEVDFNRPFTQLSFDKGRIDVSPKQSVTPKVALLELGIILLEIWHKMTLEIRFALSEEPVGYYTRLALAFEWLDDMSDPLPELYDKAVSCCVRGVIGGESHFANWEDIEFWGGVCGDIIEPLSRNCKQWR